MDILSDLKHNVDLVRSVNYRPTDICRLHSKWEMETPEISYCVNMLLNHIKQCYSINLFGTNTMRDRIHAP